MEVDECSGTKIPRFETPEDSVIENKGMQILERDDEEIDSDQNSPQMSPDGSFCASPKQSKQLPNQSGKNIIKLNKVKKNSPRYIDSDEDKNKTEMDIGKKSNRSKTRGNENLTVQVEDMDDLEVSKCTTDVKTPAISN